ncbi:hypothetical protein EPN52_02650 [bacterium]|nr:MAG: hypothetical protein EPN52_02650 [bacterium]
MSRSIVPRTLPPAAVAILATAVLLASADLGRSLWRLHEVSVRSAADRAALAAADTALGNAAAVRAHRERLLLALRGSHHVAGAWLEDVERAARRRGLVLTAVHPVDAAAPGRAPVDALVREAAEVRVSGSWRAMEVWLHALPASSGSVGVESIALQPAHGKHTGVLEARTVLLFAALQRPGGGE